MAASAHTRGGKVVWKVLQDFCGELLVAFQVFCFFISLGLFSDFFIFYFILFYFFYLVWDFNFSLILGENFFLTLDRKGSSELWMSDSGWGSLEKDHDFSLGRKVGKASWLKIRRSFNIARKMLTSFVKDLSIFNSSLGQTYIIFYLIHRWFSGRLLHPLSVHKYMIKFQSTLNSTTVGCLKFSCPHRTSKMHWFP